MHYENICGDMAGWEVIMHVKSLYCLCHCFNKLISNRYIYMRTNSLHLQTESIQCIYVCVMYILHEITLKRKAHYHANCYIIYLEEVNIINIRCN